MAISGKVGDRGNIGQAIGTGLGSPDAIKRQVDELEVYLMKMYTNVDKHKSKLEKAYRQEKKKEELKIQQEIAEKTGDVFKQATLKIKESFAHIGDSLNKAVNSLGNTIDKYIDVYTRYMGGITTRLQGTNLTYDRLIQNVTRNLGTSPYLRQEDMISNLNKFVESGISYNLETRAYIATATSKIATTFNAFDNSLLRIIRIQQADSTVARLGMESILTKFFNAAYGDTSYLNSTSKSVSAALLEAESLMGYKGASQFEYAIQRALGTMSSLGVSENTISTLASGLGYLGSGQVSALTGNQSLMRLLTLGASTAGLDIGSILTGGLSPQNAVNILSGVITYGKGLAGMSNNVARAEFASQLGLTVSDIVSLTNITTQDLKTITSNILSYEQLRNETTTQLSTLSQRTSTSEKIQNVLSNVMTSMGMNVATNPVAYGIWEAANLLQSSGLDYQFSVAPFGMGIKFSFGQLLKTGVIGLSAITSIANAIGNLGSGNLGGTSLSVWGEQETRGRGLATDGIASGRTVSTSTYMGSIESGAGTMAQAKEQAEYAGVNTNEEDNDLAVLKNITKTSIAPNVQSILDLLRIFETRLVNSTSQIIF